MLKFLTALTLLGLSSQALAEWIPKLNCRGTVFDSQDVKVKEGPVLGTYEFEKSYYSEIISGFQVVLSRQQGLGAPDSGYSITIRYQANESSVEVSGEGPLQFLYGSERIHCSIRYQ